MQKLKEPHTTEMPSLDDLSQLFWLKKEIKADENRLKEIRLKAYAPPSPDLSGMPHAVTNDRSTTAEYAAALSDLEELIQDKLNRCAKEQYTLEKWIKDIPSSEVRFVMTERFINGLQWNEIAEKIGPGHTGDRVKKVVYRYLNMTKRRH